MFHHARAMRRRPTEAEHWLWYRLRNRQLAGFKFRRQHRVGPYICDFACLEANLVVEVDGSQHGDQVDYDRRRDAYLFESGFRVLRFTNVEALHQTDDVLATLHAFLTKP
ncbi:MAG: endonuclease domain-containing protein [Proteobacteria bacterium]|nr:endonuclease domain-containing protein [Pseudomonadota bacterium]